MLRGVSAASAIAAVAICAVLAKFLRARPYDLLRLPADEAMSHIGAGSLLQRLTRSETWSEGADLMSGRRPRLYTVSGSPILGELPCWRWNTSYLSKHGADAWVGALSATRDTDGAAEIVLARGREAEFERSSGVHSIHDITLAQILRRTTAQPESDDDTVIYHAGRMSHWGRQLQADTQGLYNAFATHDEPPDYPLAWPAASLNAWLGSRGVLATPHYDPSHNVVIQVIGRKRWVLWPPSQLHRVRLHPASHPSRRQTRQMLSWMLHQRAGDSAGSGQGSAGQGSAGQGSAGQGSGGRRDGAVRDGAVRGDRSDAPPFEGAFSVEMVEGDIMYVPPYWTHAVLSTGALGAAASPSLSISLISPSWVEMTWGLVRAVSLPFGDPFGTGAHGGRGQHRSFGVADLAPLRIAAVGRYVRALLRSDNAAKAFLTALYWQRHAPLTSRDVMEAHAARDHSECPAERAHLSAAVTGADDDASLAHAAEAVHGLLARRGEQPQQQFDDDVRLHLLRDYVDELVAWAVGDKGSCGEQLRCWTAG